MVGKYHTFSVGLLIGGTKKDFDLEQHQIGTTNIIIATPGRLLQHLEQTPYFDVSLLRMLVLDEADRILDMGFRDQLLKILEYVPTEGRQTLLFSATQTRDISKLATLSLRNPEYLGVHDKEKTSTPEALQQSYVVVPLEHKLDAVYSFVKSHLKCKSILFLASCAQVRYAWELFCNLRPGVPVMALHGKLAQEKRTQIYFDFLQRPHAVLFATDIAARGLDFPNVDWVVQVDAPEDRDMYIHRAGRTARYRSGGKSLLLLTPSEEKKGFVQLLNKLPLKKLSINPNKAAIVTQRAASLVAANVKLHQLAKKAYRSYVRSVYLMPNKDVFDAKDLPVNEFSKSLGLASTPSLSFLKADAGAQDRSQVRQKKNVNHKLRRLKEQIKAEKMAKRLRNLGKSDAEVETATQQFLGKKKEQEEDDSDEDVIVSKRREAWDDDRNTLPLPDVGLHEVSRSRHPKKIRIDGSNVPNKRTRFDEDGKALDSDRLIVEAAADDDALAATKLEDKKALEKASEEYSERVRQKLAKTLEQDQAEERYRVRQKHKKRRLAERGDRADGEQQGEGGVPVVLGLDSVSNCADTRDSENDSILSTSSSVSISDKSDESSDLKAQEEIALSLIRGRK